MHPSTANDHLFFACDFFDREGMGWGPGQTAFLHSCRCESVFRRTRPFQVSRPVLVARRWAWDETGQKLTLSLPGTDASSRPEAVRSTWEVMVMRMKVVVSWGGTSTYTFDLILPQILVTSLSAAGIYYAMRSPAVASNMTGLKMLADTADICIEVPVVLSNA